MHSHLRLLVSHFGLRVIAGQTSRGVRLSASPPCGMRHRCIVSMNWLGLSQPAPHPSPSLLSFSLRCSGRPLHQLLCHHGKESFKCIVKARLKRWRQTKKAYMYMYVCMNVWMYECMSYLFIYFLANLNCSVAENVHIYLFIYFLCQQKREKKDMTAPRISLTDSHEIRVTTQRAGWPIQYMVRWF